MKQWEDSTSSSSVISASAIQNIVDELRLYKHRNSTKANYYSVWRSFNEFFIKLDFKPDKVGGLLDSICRVPDPEGTEKCYN